MNGQVFKSLSKFMGCLYDFSKMLFLRGKLEQPGMFIKNHFWFVFKNFVFQWISLYWREKLNF